MKSKNSIINISIISSIIFIIASLISLLILLNEKNNNKYFSNKKALNISFYNRIVIVFAVALSLYVSIYNFNTSGKNNRAKYKTSLLLITSILTIISSIIVLYVSYLNKEEQSLNVSDIENPLI